MSMIWSNRKFKASVNDLRVPTVLEQAVDVDDGEGGEVRTWQPQTGTIMVADQIRHAVYIAEGGQQMVENLHIIILRYNAAVTSGARWRFNGKFGIWYIKTVNDPLNNRQWLVASCTEEAP